MAGLLSLSAELLYEVFDHLQPHDEVHPMVREQPDFDPDNVWDYPKSYRALAALARTCKLLLPIARQSLYKHHWAQYSRPNCIVLSRLIDDASIRQAIKHIRVLQDGPYCHRHFHGRSRADIEADLRRIPVLERADVAKILEHDILQLHVAILVA
ncbi:hypothetical protein BDV95DRAFT_603023 [Massariosphaeria phaeospora]|uniref:Uncharacterized protein n=1 Tax=Massariosphaeria phaeospora TaxID=100035 RepID=A0A7C8IBV2_9PLEO|nr:hypothetical protein BDV95DRAFT_603023 [Massariosphaeria phaeospora]